MSGYEKADHRIARPVLCPTFCRCHLRRIRCSPLGWNSLGFLLYSHFQSFSQLVAAAAAAEARHLHRLFHRRSLLPHLQVHPLPHTIPPPVRLRVAVVIASAH